MISLNNVSVVFGGKPLLDGISFHVSHKDKIGLVGRNGAGKSTIMKLICGLQEPSGGRIDVPSSLSVGYLPQIMQHEYGRTVIEEAMTVFSEMKNLEEKMSEINEELASRTDYDSEEYLYLIEKLNNIGDLIAYGQSDPPQARAEKILAGMGFDREDLERPTETFSRGWNMRIELAKILLQNPDVLLLDEPTNHLDIESIEWLENYLKSYGGAVILVSHDKRFLDNVTTRTIEIVLGGIHDYRVSYSHYLKLREERMAALRAACQNQKKLIEQTEEFIEKFRYKPSKSNQVQSRIKAMEKLELIEPEEEDTSSLHVKFPVSGRSGDIVFKAENLVAGYPEKVVFTKSEIIIKRGEKIALIGRNGEGKTTLLRIISGNLKPLEGECSSGHNVETGYFEQNQDEVLDGNLTVFETLDNIAVGEIRTRLRNILGCFLFKGESIDKKVSVLSGGERARLGMAKLLLEPHNLLLLDEPTNHLDIRSKDVLKAALKSYAGTLVIVSHDRDFLEGLVDKLYEFREGKVIEHSGSISDFLGKRKLEVLSDLERKVEMTDDRNNHVSVAKQEFLLKKNADREERKIKNRISSLEKQIMEQEQKLAELEKKLGTASGDEIISISGEYSEIKKNLELLTEEWGSLI